MDKLQQLQEKIKLLAEQQKKLKAVEKQIKSREAGKARKERAAKLVQCGAYLVGEHYEWLYGQVKEKTETAHQLQVMILEYISSKK